VAEAAERCLEVPAAAGDHGNGCSGAAEPAEREREVEREVERERGEERG
jgi:hypothetical protein